MKFILNLKMLQQEQLIREAKLFLRVIKHLSNIILSINNIEGGEVEHKSQLAEYLGENYPNKIQRLQ